MKRDASERNNADTGKQVGVSKGVGGLGCDGDIAWDMESEVAGKTKAMRV